MNKIRHMEVSHRPRFACLSLLILLVLSLAWPAHAELREQDIPPELSPWVNWVLPEQGQLACPRMMDETSAFFCAWPGRLFLRESADAMQFRQSWRLYDRAWVPLPGEAGLWPEEVRVDGREWPVIDRRGRPHVRLPEGTHLVSGLISWTDRPTHLQLPYQVGLVSVEGLQGPTVIDDRYRLQLAREESPSGGEAQPDELNVTVARKLDDRVPTRLETRVTLKVSGKAREMRLGKALLDGFRLLSFDTPLPARIDENGMLQVQVRPGRWDIRFEARKVADEAPLGPGENAGAWPAEEYWAFQERPDLRQVRVDGPAQVEPAQLPLPREWQHLPVFVLTKGDRLDLTVLQRGAGSPEPGTLSLKRQLWLDFDGAGASVQDRIYGQMNGQRRLEALKEPELGRVTVNGEPAMITRLPERESLGFEVRPNQVNVVTAARLDAQEGAMPFSLAVSGWLQSFDSVQWTLHLPPGWWLFATDGVDSVHGSWLAQWSIWNLFLVLLVAVACGRTFGWKWSALALVFGLLLYQEYSFMIWLLLVLVILTALWRNVSGDRLKKVAGALRGAALLGFVIVGLGVVVMQMRLAVFPQLEWQGSILQQPVASPRADRMEAERLRSPAVSSLKSESRMADMDAAGYAAEPKPLPTWDPDARIQSGPGLPDWQWKQARLHWNGPVEATERVDMWLLPPAAVSLLRIVSVIVIGLLAVRCFLSGNEQGPGRSEPPDDNAGGQGATATTTTSLLLAGLLLGMAVPSPGYAQSTPDPALLDELKQRLMAPPDCAPACASERRTLLVLDGYGLTLTQQFSAVEPAVVALPAHREAWVPDSVIVDGEQVDRLQFNDNGFLILHLEEGNHEVVMEADVRERDQLALRFPRAPHRFAAKIEDWQAFGLVRGAPASGTVRFERKQVSARRAESRSTLFAEPPPPFVEVERTLTLGNRWETRTVVQRVAPQKGPVEVDVPVLPGESVTTSSVEVSEGRVKAVIPAGENAVGWEGYIEPVDQLTLNAGQQDKTKDIWNLVVGPQWHVETNLLPPVQRRDREGYWRPSWHPYAGESLLLSISRPEPLPGQTMTIEKLALSHMPSTSGYQGRVDMRVRTSIADRLQWQLPEGLQLQGLSIDGQSRPLLDDRSQVDVALDAGSHVVQLDVKGQPALAWHWESPDWLLPWPVANLSHEVVLPRDRWLIFAEGAGVGPAILYWSVLPLLIILAIALARHERNPLGFLQWLLLGLGLSLANPWSAILIVAWFYALSDRTERHIDNDQWFNLRQVGLVVLTVISFLVLLASVPYGLLAEPSMWVTGNGSSAHQLNWYLDHTRSDELPSVVLWSLPLWVYRLAMLLWSLWLAVAVVDWLRWGWKQITSETGWRSRSKVVSTPREVPPRTESNQDWDQS